MIYSPIIVSIVCGLVWYYFDYNSREDDMWVAYSATVLAGFLISWLPAYYLVRQDKRKGKTIYDRWVMQHGTDPDKWPAPAKPE